MGPLLIFLPESVLLSQLGSIEFHSFIGLQGTLGVLILSYCVIQIWCWHLERLIYILEVKEEPVQTAETNLQPLSLLWRIFFVLIF